MLKNFPILTDEKVQKFTDEGFVIVFRYMKAIDEIRPKEILHKSEIEEAKKLADQHCAHEIEKILPFCEGYEFLKNSEMQYNLYCSPVWNELETWVEYYDISDRDNEDERSYGLV